MITLLEVFAVSFIAGFTGTLTAFTAQYYLYTKQKEDLKKLKKSIQTTVRNAGKKEQKRKY